MSDEQWMLNPNYARRRAVAERLDLTRREQAELVGLSYATWRRLAPRYAPSEPRTSATVRAGKMRSSAGLELEVRANNRSPMVWLVGAPLSAIGAQAGDVVVVRVRVLPATGERVLELRRAEEGA